jgi:hypothetical protein
MFWELQKYEARLQNQHETDTATLLISHRTRHRNYCAQIQLALSIHYLQITATGYVTVSKR